MNGEDPTERVAVIGAGGHVGMPLTLVLADAGYDVTGIDTNDAVNEKLSRGVVPHLEHGAEELLRSGLASGRLRFTSSLDAVDAADVVVVIVGTPIDDNLNPRVDALRGVVETLVPRMRPGQLVVLRSTVSPGTTQLVRDVIEAGSGLREGEGFYLVFAPERVLQTHAINEIRGLPQLVGAFSDAGFERAKRFFARFNDRPCERLSPVEAEIGKLVTNMARYVSFALANEFYMICDAHAANAHRVIAACNKDYPRLDLPRPGPNVGGPCLYKDGHFLIDTVPYSEIILGSFRINESMPRYLLDKVRRRVPSLKRAGVLGMTFKADCDDTRNSLSFKLVKQLRAVGAEAACVDPYVPQYLDTSALRGVEALVLMTPHRAFRGLAELLAIVDNPDCVVVDAWNFWTECSPLAHDGVYTARDALAQLSRAATR